MTDRGREFTAHLKRKAALKGKEEFRLQFVSFEKSIYDIGNPDFIRSELQKLKSLADMQYKAFIDSMNLMAGLIAGDEGACHLFVVSGTLIIV